MMGGQLLYHLGDRLDRPKWLPVTFSTWASKMAITHLGDQGYRPKMAIAYLGNQVDCPKWLPVNFTIWGDQNGYQSTGDRQNKLAIRLGDQNCY